MNNLPLKIVIFGATGDLVKKKIIPAIFNLYKNNLIQEDFEILGVSRKTLSDKDFQKFISDSLEPKDNIDDFISRCRYFSADISNKETLTELVEKVNQGETNNIYYLAISPNLYEKAFINIAESGFINPNNGWDRVLVEKPFGNDLSHAKHLDGLLGRLFDEDQVFRIDHYLSKEILQNILTFRFANSIFEPIWNSDSIEEIKIEMYETADVDNRGAFYDSVGALRDVGQNHILQMLSLVTMEDPTSLNITQIRDSRAAVLENISFVENSNSIKESLVLSDFQRAQYKTYNKIPEINPETKTETFFSIQAEINNQRWKGTKFNLISGKALNKTFTEINIVFKEKYTSVCPEDDERDFKNVITFKIQPTQEIQINFWHKKPGFSYEVDSKKLSFNYINEASRIPDAYEKVLFDAIKGDQTSFISTREILAQWSFVEKVTKSWIDKPIFIYEKGIDPNEKLSTI